MINNWDELLLNAVPLVSFLGRDSYFGSAYSGATAGRLVLRDANAARHFASDDSFDSFDEWQTVTDAPDVFPQNFEWKRWIDYNLTKNNHFSLGSKNFSGADTKWLENGGCLLLELMHRDMRILLNCYANEIFPPVWESILDVYLHDGFPCGWNGRYPSGELVVFSNC